MEVKTHRPVIAATTAVILATVVLAAVLVLNIVLVTQIGETNRMVQALAAGEDDVAQENDVLIANQYVIKSTEHISDAYKSGDNAELSDKDKETLDMASAVLDEIITEGMSDYEKEKAVYDWMTHNLEYDSGALLVVPTTDADCDNPYGVLKYHNAVCVGYATTFRMFMQMMDIECMVVHNSDRYHSWDLVKLDDAWYHTDIYSDSGSGNYSHFNLNDTAQGQDQTWDRDFFPAANGCKYNYAVMNKTEVESIFNIPEQLRSALDEQQSICSLSFAEEINETKAQIVEVMLNDISSRIKASSEYSGTYLSWNWVPADEGYVLCINIYGLGNEDPIDPEGYISDEDLEKLNNTVDAAFGDLETEYDWEDIYDGQFGFEGMG